MIPPPALNIWEHSRQLRELCRRRAMGLEPEMDCAAQGAEILSHFVDRRGMRLLDVGCGGGHLVHSLARIGIELDYYGLDYSPAMVGLARKARRSLGLDPGRIILGDVRGLVGFECDLVAMINTLSFNPDFREPLDRLAGTGAKVMVIRDFFGPSTVVSWERDGFLDEPHNHLKGYWNQWSTSEVASFMGDLGFNSTFVPDHRTMGRTEIVVGKPYIWSWLVAERA
ncbi:MAG: class I SAM-dependent methyltransferase [Deltaproteobacteria bacterium]|jgi:SAM-dependent methyltransferase|nr:class I SAM-dependent methyltransferase [Deltaproteobacteria bacterium]